MNKLFEIGGDQITQELTNKFIWSISEYERAENGEKFRQSTIKIYLKILKKNPNIPDALMQVIAWILGEYGANSEAAKVEQILNLLSQFSYGTFEDEKTRACILLALTKLHTALQFQQNDYVQQIMSDYLLSRNLEVQQRAFDYKFLHEKHHELPNNGKDLIFHVPLTESQVSAECCDFSLDFLDSVVEQQLAEGKPPYDPEKSNIVSSGGELGQYAEEAGSTLNFTPYQQSHIGMTKHSASQPHSNPMLTGGAGSIDAQATGIGGITGPEVGGQPRPAAQLAVNNIKKVWGAPVEEAKESPPPQDNNV